MRDYLVIALYGLIVMVSLFGNLLVCKVIQSKQTMRNRTTHLFIANLTISDLLMTIFTIPMNIARQILDDWPFGDLCCKLVPFVQAISVYVSSLSMTMIAIDRYQTLCRPMKPRIIQQISKWFWITSIWLVASILALPYAMFNHVVDVLNIPTSSLMVLSTTKPLFRCKAIYPGDDPQSYRRVITLLAFTTQFCIPMIIVAVCYILIGMKISRRSCIGEHTIEQVHQHLNSKRKTIKMLIVVVATFAICWLPYNLLYIVEDFFQINFSLSIHYIAHWLAMSSICYNPFIYFWLNRGYRQGILNILTCCLHFQCLKQFNQSKSMNKYDDGLEMDRANQTSHQLNRNCSSKKFRKLHQQNSQNIDDDHLNDNPIQSDSYSKAMITTTKPTIRNSIVCDERKCRRKISQELNQPQQNKHRNGKLMIISRRLVSNGTQSPSPSSSSSTIQTMTIDRSVIDQCDQDHRKRAADRSRKFFIKTNINIKSSTFCDRTSSDDDDDDDDDDNDDQSDIRDNFDSGINSSMMNNEISV
ncbi:putative G-protein coupled receptor 83 [Sarcoptes scabiei]|uniref:Putative G-protein coupled receptor 83 n=1 Tax=Sarcoptes scabiei TaxID=52283 RepID=A0A834VF25_SARSC|nr:putative G-protein coupled receptor 83 [Sarcoptes scabiei]